MVKIKIKITGRKVHDVGYRPFLIAMADEFELDGIGVRNVEVEGQQAVLVKAEGDEDSIQSFKAAIEERQAEGADVSSVKCEPFDGRVPSIERTAITNMNFQLAKGISALISVDGTLTKMDKKMDKMLDKQDQTIDEIIGLRGDLKDDLGERLKRVEKDVRTIKSKVGLR
jgi:acylphosphatase